MQRFADPFRSYYLLRPEDGVTVKPFPENFRMIAGDGTLRSWPWPDQKTNDPRFGVWTEEDKYNEDKKRQHAIGWNCLNGNGGPVEDTLGRKFLPQGMHCDYGLRAEIVFPSCWDGIHDDTADHRSHVAYPTHVESGECPPGFPVRLPTLLYEVIWNTHELVSKRKGRLVASTGDCTGEFSPAFPLGLMIDLTIPRLRMARRFHERLGHQPPP